MVVVWMKIFTAINGLQYQCYMQTSIYVAQYKIGLTLNKRYFLFTGTIELVLHWTTLFV